MIKIDLHSHSAASPDGSLRLKDYRTILESKINYIAITDHDRIDFASQLKKLDIGKQLIVGEEVMTNEGEIIGLYLTERVKPGMSPKATVAEIKQQGGLVVIPHPIDDFRSGLGFEQMDIIKDDIDAIEVLNGRALKNYQQKLTDWAAGSDIALIASSDAHDRFGLGRSYTQLADDADVSSAKGLKEALLTSTPIYGRPPILAFLAPKFNRLTRRFKKSDLRMVD